MVDFSGVRFNAAHCAFSAFDNLEGAKLTHYTNEGGGKSH